MVSPDPAIPHGPAPNPESLTATRALRSYGYQLLAALLGIALAFM